MNKITDMNLNLIWGQTKFYLIFLDCFLQKFTLNKTISVQITHMTNKNYMKDKSNVQNATHT